MTTVAAVSEGRIPYKWKAFFAVALSLVTMVMSMSINILALPVIARDFHVTLREVSWVVIGFSLTVTALLMPLGRFSDLVGRRRCLLWGLGLFAGGALLCALSKGLALLIGGRVIMGVGSAMGQGVGTAIVVSIFPPQERGKGIGASTTAVAVGGASGPVVAGILLQFFPWQALFIAMAIPAAAAFFWGYFILDDDKIGSFQARDRIFDWPGAVLSAALMLVFVLTINNPFRPDNPRLMMFGGLLLSLLLLIWFAAVESKTRSPIIDIRLFANPVFRYASITRVLGFMSRAASFLLLPVFLLNIKQINAGMIGMIMLVAAIGMGIGAQAGGRLSDRHDPDRYMIIGFLIAIISGLGMAFFDEKTSMILILSVLFVNGVSMGLWATPNLVSTMNSTPKSSLGPVGALVNLTRNTGNVIGQATVTAVITAVMASAGFNLELSQVGQVSGSMEAFIHAWKVSYLVIIGFYAAALVSSLMTRPAVNRTRLE